MHGYESKSGRMGPRWRRTERLRRMKRMQIAGGPCLDGLTSDPTGTEATFFFFKSLGAGHDPAVIDLMPLELAWSLLLVASTVFE